MKKTYIRPETDWINADFTDILTASLLLDNGAEDGYGYNGEDWVK